MQHLIEPVFQFQAAVFHPFKLLIAGDNATVFLATDTMVYLMVFGCHSGKVFIVQLELVGAGSVFGEVSLEAVIGIRHVCLQLNECAFSA